MKTLNKETTAALFATPEGYNELKRRWSEGMRDTERRKEMRCAHHVLYLVLRGRNWQRALTPVTNATKLANGVTPGGSAHSAVAAMQGEAVFEPFADLLSDDASYLIRTLIPAPRWNEDVLAREPYADLK